MWGFGGRALRGWPVALSIVVAGVQAATPSEQFTLAGAVAAPRGYRLADLQALPALTQTVQFLAAGAPQTRIFTGALLWRIVESAGVVPDPDVKGDLLSKVVVASGTDGYRAVYSVGELHPEFGNRAVLVAYTEGEPPVPLAASGFARLTSPGDAHGARYLTNLARLEVRGCAAFAPGAGGPSAQFQLAGAVQHARVVDLAALQALPQVRRTVGADTYQGASVWDLLQADGGLALNPAVHNDAVGKYVVATGSDGYRVAFSLGELDPANGAQALLAYALNGSALGTKGLAQLVVPTDVKKSRWVANLARLQVCSTDAAPSL